MESRVRGVAPVEALLIEPKAHYASLRHGKMPHSTFVWIIKLHLR